MNMNPSGTGPSTLPTHTCARTPPSSCPSGRCAGSRTPLARRCACQRSKPEHDDTAGESQRENFRLVQTGQEAAEAAYLQDSGFDSEVELPVHLHPLPHLDLPTGGEQLAWEVKG